MLSVLMFWQLSELVHVHTYMHMCTKHTVIYTHTHTLSIVSVLLYLSTVIEVQLPMVTKTHNNLTNFIATYMHV